MKGKTELKSLSEKALLDLWIESVKFALLNVFQIYMKMGEGHERLKSRGTGASIPIEKFLNEYIADLVLVCRSYGGFLVEGIKIGNLDPERIWEARNELLEEIKNSSSPNELKLSK